MAKRVAAKKAPSGLAGWLFGLGLAAGAVACLAMPWLAIVFALWGAVGAGFAFGYRWRLWKYAPLAAIVPALAGLLGFWAQARIERNEKFAAALAAVKERPAAALAGLREMSGDWPEPEKAKKAIAHCEYLIEKKAAEKKLRAALSVLQKAGKKYADDPAAWRMHVKSVYPELPKSKRGKADNLLQKIDATLRERNVAEAIKIIDTEPRAALKRLQTLNDGSKRIDDAIFRAREKIVSIKAAERKKKLARMKAEREAKERQKQLKQWLGQAGPKPQNSAWDGSVDCVQKHMDRTLHDPDSLKDVTWYKPVLVSHDGLPAWAVRVEFRATNAFGAYIKLDKCAIIRGGKLAAFADASQLGTLKVLDKNKKKPRSNDFPSDRELMEARVRLKKRLQGKLRAQAGDRPFPDNEPRPVIWNKPLAAKTAYAWRGRIALAPSHPEGMNAAEHLVGAEMIRTIENPVFEVLCSVPDGPDKLAECAAWEGWHLVRLQSGSGGWFAGTNFVGAGGNDP